MTTSRGRGDQGAVPALELVLVTPLFVVLLVFAVYCGRLGRTAQVVRALAASAARAASVERSPDAAAVAARDVAAASDDDLSCEAPAVSFDSDDAVDTVTVRVRCDASVIGLSLLGLGASRTFTESATEPLDAYRGR
jgi:Flp pilus assembly protein TadG